MKTKLLFVIPWDLYQHLENKFSVNLTDCTGIVEHNHDKDIWFGFINHQPIRVTYRSSDHKTTWSRCNLELVKQKLRGVK